MITGCVGIFGMPPKQMKAHKTDTDAEEPPVPEDAVQSDMDVGDIVDAPFNKEEFMRNIKAEVSSQLAVVLPDMIAKAVDNSFDKLTSTVQKLEARQAKHDRRLHELGNQVSAVQDQLTKMSINLEKMTERVLAGPPAASSGRRLHHPRSARSALPTRPRRQRSTTLARLAARAGISGRMRKTRPRCLCIGLTGCTKNTCERSTLECRRTTAQTFPWTLTRRCPRAAPLTG